MYGIVDKKLAKTFHTRKEAEDALAVLRHTLNAYRAWWRLEADAIVVVHRLYLAKEHWMRFGIQEVDRQLATSKRWCPHRHSNGRYYALYQTENGPAYAHQEVTKAYGFNYEHVDHISRDNTLDNRIENLADGSGKNNARNQAMHVSNTSGVTGVTEAPTSFRAAWRENDGRYKTKRFSTLKYGRDMARTLAIAARKEAAQRLGIQNGTTPSVALSRKRAAEAAALASREEVDAEDADVPADDADAAREQESDAGDDDGLDGESAPPAQPHVF
jgi:hypothetical protein